MPEAESKWQGDCFVFDARVSVGHELKEDLSAVYVPAAVDLPEDKERLEYEHGVAVISARMKQPRRTKTAVNVKNRSSALRERGDQHMVGYGN